jgi:hypothetical protein
VPSFCSLFASFFFVFFPCEEKKRPAVWCVFASGISSERSERALSARVLDARESGAGVSRVCQIECSG